MHGGGGGACVAGGYAWQGASMVGVYMAGGMHGRGCAWQGHMHGSGVCVAGGCAW